MRVPHTPSSYVWAWKECVGLTSEVQVFHPFVLPCQVEIVRRTTAESAATGESDGGSRVGEGKMVEPWRG